MMVQMLWSNLKYKENALVRLSKFCETITLNFFLIKGIEIIVLSQELYTATKFDLLTSVMNIYIGRKI